MKLSNYKDFPADIPVIAEDELFLYPFMISPLFLSDENNIKNDNCSFCGEHIVGEWDN